MPGLEDITYSEAACIAAVSGFYEFLTKIYLDDSAVIYPPEGGWPSIVQADPGVLSSLGKSDKVISLLAHLPYIKSTGGIDDNTQAVADCPFADWNDFFTGAAPGESMESCRIVTEGFAFYEVAPPHVIGLTASHRDAFVMVLDTELGIVHWDGYPFRDIGVYIRDEICDDPYDWAPEEEAEWRADAVTWEITDFFEVLKGLYIELLFIPISNQEVYLNSETWGHPPGMISMLRKIYKDHGWPDMEAYRKEDCLNAIREAIEANYPDI
ncbi:hypothetical protein PG999_009868 [Apiospora kogelbergensis]|uniref:SUKH-4 immunity protein n=1 Tax=Apiospora kogelbergensis TaxID=1337665 RepID=A0AAW0QLV3_9PEZI